MKNFFSLLVLLTAFSFAHAQDLADSGVPKPVKATFDKSFPGVSGVEWEKEGKYYVAEFKQGGHETEAVFDATGKLMETESEIGLNDLPKAAQDYLAKKQPGQQPREVTKETNSKGKVSYEAEYRGAEYEFDEKGNPAEDHDDDHEDGENDDDDDDDDRP